MQSVSPSTKFSCFASTSASTLEPCCSSLVPKLARAAMARSRVDWNDMGTGMAFSRVYCARTVKSRMRMTYLADGAASGLQATFFPCLRAFPLRRPPPLLGWLGGPYESPGLKPAAFAVDASHDAIASVSSFYSRYVLMRTLGSIVTFCNCFNSLLVSARCGRAKGPRLQSGNLRRGRGVTSLDGTGVISSN